MPRHALKQLGLSDTEIQIYLTTLSLGQTLVSTIASKCGIKRTSTYAIIEKLVEKGFLTSITQKNVTYFMAIDPEVLVEKCKQQVSRAQSMLREMEKAIPVLVNMQDKNETAKVEYFEGISGMHSMYADLLLKPITVKSFVYLKDATPDFYTFVNEYFPKREPFITKDSKTILIKDKIHQEYRDTVLRNDNGQMKMISEELMPLRSPIQIYDNKCCFYSMQSQPLIGIKIENERIFHTLSSLFDYVWATIK